MGVVIVTAQSSTIPIIRTLKLLTRGAMSLDGQWSGRFTLDIKSNGDNTWEVSTHVSNRIWCTLSYTPAGGWASGGACSTRMMPAPEEAGLEAEIIAILGAVTALRRDGDNLVLEGNGKTEVFKAA